MPRKLRPPFRCDKYCACCGRLAHYLKEELSQADPLVDWYECAFCGHLISTPKGKGAGLRWYTRERKRGER